MFSIAAINDTDSKDQWEPLAPTKEAQEFHLSQIYHEGLLKLQEKEYGRACELLETVLKDPLLPNGQVDNSGSDAHLLQLRFLALKNLATAFLQQGSHYYEDALRCYIQAVEIDSKDSVVWNQLGTLSCSMGLLTISRWAFEQGLLCSPNNWNCMEKLLEVLIAIGDEVACLSVSELILRHWPSHSRALHVKKTIEESEPIPFAPRGIDKLEPKHVRLKFLDKRKAAGDDLNECVASKKLKTSMEIHLPEASWAALARALLRILAPADDCDSEQGVNEFYRCADIRLNLYVPCSSENVNRSLEKIPMVNPSSGYISCGDGSAEKGSISKERETIMCEEPHHERRSSRLESLRSRKPSKEELDFATGKDLAKAVVQFLGPFIVGEMETKISSNNTSFPCTEVVTNPLNNESAEVVRFVQETSTNYGAYHMGHLLLEEIASKGILYQDAFGKILDLEKLTRKWGRERTPECNLFLAELYFDSGTQTSDSRRWSDSMSEASYHLCKVIESVALDYPFYNNDIAGDDNCTPRDGSQSNCPIDYMLSNKRSFWARFFWLSGKLSALNGDKEKAQKEFGVSLSLLTAKDNVQSSLVSISLPHCRIMNELTVDRILREINLLEVDFLLKETLNEMIEKELYSECITLLAPLLFCAEDAHLGVSCVVGNEDEGITSTELSALDVLLKACQKSTPMDIEVYLKCHRRKLQILLAAAGVEDCFDSQRSFERSKFNALAASESESNESSSMFLHRLISEEVKAISQFASQMKSFSNSYGSCNDFAVLVRIIGNIQYSLLAVMCNIVSLDFSKKSFGLGVMNDNERRQRCCFIDAATAFFKLQHLNPSLPVKTHIDLITAIHELLAEYGLCCAGGDGEEEGTFLKLAIKHLLSLDMRLKSDSFNKGLEITQCDDKVSHDHGKETESDPEPEKLKVEACKFRGTEKDENRRMSNDDSSYKDAGEDGEIDTSEVGSSIGMLCKGEERGCKVVECEKEPTEDEKEEVEVGIDSALNQCFYCLYGLHLRSDSSYEDDLATHRNTSRGDYQTKEQCADVFQYILPYAMASSRTRLVKLRRVLRSIRKHFPQPPDEILAGNVIDKFLDNPDLCENKLSAEAGSDGFLDVILKVMYPDALVKQHTASTESSEPFLQVYRNLYYLLAQSEEMSATDKWAGFVLTKEGEDFVQQNANLLKYDLLYNPLRFESWERLANIYDEEVDLLLNDGSKQINVTGWRKNATLHQRVDASRRRSRRCLLMTLALAKTAAQQGEIHELLALVYYDGLQNVVPIYDQKSIIPSKDATWMTFCQNSMEHFKKAFAQKEEWSYAYYMGKLSEKLKCSHETSFAYYDNAITLNPSAVDPFYRMHASRLKLLCACGKNNEEALKVVAAYSFSQSTKDTALSIFHEINSETSQLGMNFEDKNSETKNGNTKKVQTLLKDLWHMLYKDCLSALEICVEGDLKHFHKARYMLAQGLYKRNDSGDLEKAKDELSFCFKSSRSSFTINMWEIDGMVKKGRRKAPGLSGNRKVLEVNLPESSRKFITCIRKYILFYMKLLDETGDISTLERAYISLRADKRFSLCLEDLVPIALGRYIKALISSIHQAEISNGTDANSLEHLEKLFSLFMEQTNVWSEICNLREVRCPELSESSLYGSLYKYIQILERNVRLDTLEGINEKMRKRLKNPKLSNSNCAKVYKHVSVAWCRSLLTSLALITPLELKLSSEIQVPSLFGGPGNSLLCVDLQTDEYWSSSFEDPTHLKNLKTQWNHILSKINDVIIKKVSEENLDNATMLLRSAYNFYRDASCALLPSGIKLFVFPAQSTEMHVQPRMEILEMNTPKKLLLWAYTLLHGHCNTNISAVIKCCEETVKSKLKKGSGTSSIPPSASMPNAATSQTGIMKDSAGSCNEQERVASATIGNVEYVPTGETEAPEHLDSSKPGAEGNCYVAASLLHGAETKGHLTSDASLEDQTVSRSNESISQGEKGLSATPILVHCTSADSEKNNVDETGADYARG